MIFFFLYFLLFFSFVSLFTHTPSLPPSFSSSFPSSGKLQDDSNNDKPSVQRVLLMLGLRPNIVIQTARYFRESLFLTPARVLGIVTSECGEFGDLSHLLQAFVDTREGASVVSITANEVATRQSVLNFAARQHRSNGSESSATRKDTKDNLMQRHLRLRALDVFVEAALKSVKASSSPPHPPVCFILHPIPKTSEALTSYLRIYQLAALLRRAKIEVTVSLLDFPIPAAAAAAAATTAAAAAADHSLPHRGPFFLPSFLLDL